MSTPYHAAYWAHALSISDATGTVADLSRSIANARVDLNPHQVDAALFAIRSPLSKGAILADEVGLGKTIEAGLVIARRWAERKRRIVLVVPASLRKQWQEELSQRQDIHLFWNGEQQYIPDFVVETAGEKLLVEVKSEDELTMTRSRRRRAPRSSGARTRPRTRLRSAGRHGGIYWCPRRRPPQTQICPDLRRDSE